MSNIERLEANNADLRECIEIAENLPSAGDGGENNTKYVKFIAIPTSTSVFTVENPLGTTDITILVNRIGEYTGSARKVVAYIADSILGIGAVEFVASDGAVRYVVRKGSSSSNGYFSISAESISMRQYSAANTWDISAEYEITILQSTISTEVSYASQFRAIEDYPEITGG